MENIFINSWSKLATKTKKDFLLFLKSPYFNKNFTLIDGLHHIESKYLKTDADDIKKELFTLLYPSEKYQDSKIRYFFSDLTKLLRKFISIEFDSRAPLQVDFDSAKALNGLHLEKLQQKEWNKLSKQIDAPKFQNASTLLNTYKYYVEAQQQASIKSRKEYAYFSETTYHLEAYFVAESLRLACLNIGPISKESLSSSQSLLPYILEQVRKGKFEQSPAVAIYYYAYKMLSEQDVSHYEKLVAWLSKNWQQFPIKEIEDVYLLGINFCIAQINAGDRTFMKHAFDLYRQGLSNKVFLKDGFLSIHNYKNILRLGLTQKAYDWTESFLYEFKEWLPKEERENTFNYNLAYFYFHKEDYDSCMDLLRTVKFKDVFNNLDARRMLLRIYYEQQEWSALDSHLDSFQSFTMRQKNIGYHKVANLNLVKITRLMMKKFPLSAKSKQQIEKRIKNAAHLAEKTWVIKTAGL